MSADGAPPVLVGVRVVLDGHRDEDVADHVRGEDGETARRFGWRPRTSTVKTVRATYAEWADSWRSGGGTRAFAVRRRSDRRLVGGCELRLRGDGSAETSWWTHADVRGLGYATEAVRLLVDYARSLDILTVTAEVAVDNTASRRVASKAALEEIESFRDQQDVEMVLYRSTLARSDGVAVTDD